MKPVFRRYQWICYTYKSFRRLDLQIWMLTTDKTNCFTPCACTRGNDINWGALDDASQASCNYYYCVYHCVCMCTGTCMVNVCECACVYEAFWVRARDNSHTLHPFIHQCIHTCTPANGRQRKSFSPTFIGMLNSLVLDEVVRFDINFSHLISYCSVLTDISMKAYVYYHGFCANLPFINR